MVRHDFWGGIRRGRGTGGRRRSRGPADWAAAVVLGGAWWCAAFRLLAQPERAGPVEGLVVAGGWGLSLLPVHCVPWTRRPARGPVRRLVARVWRGAEER
ncbi:hypothetical protein ACFY1P_30720 [Streptomyces sp. NPDC001407]|uniref:hypothetical protein n=1 Tax=Streptomyces sp. NPDC001407 TaxID=3364573 RepID=UPI00369E4E79